MASPFIISRCSVITIALSGLVSSAGAGEAPAAGTKQPRKLNVLFIAVDDLNIHLGSYGYPVKTPNIDRLAQMGRRFDRAYCQYPLCNPSRTSLMSGWRPERTQVWGNEVPPRPHLTGATPLQEHFHANGYFTARAGKIYHGAFESQFAWGDQERAAGPPASQPAQTASRPAGRTPANRRGGARAGRASARRGGGVVGISWRATDREDGDEPDGRVARRVAELIEQNKDRRFFIGAGFSKPHLPWIAPRKYFQMYPPEAIRLEKGPEDDRKDIPLIALLDVGPGDPTTDAKRAQAVAAYYACVSFVDAQVGVLLDALDRLKLWDNTIVVFWGDNGFQLGEHDLWRKMTLFEEAAHVPLIIVAPGMAQKGVATRHLAELVDIYPTLVELSGLPEVRGLEGTSLVPLLKDPNRAVKTAAFTMVSRDGPIPARSVRSERYRYTEWPDGSAELYDHQADPHEYVNLVKNPASAKALAEMRGLLHPGSSLGLLRVHPSNPRYFTDGTGRAIYLTGSHTWNNLQDTGTTDPPPAMDYDRYLAVLKGYNHNFTRGWAWEQAQSDPGYKGDYFIAPLPFERTGPGNALDGKPRFDVTRFHQPYFDRLRGRAVTAGRQGIYLSVMLFEGWSIEDKQKGSGNPWPSHPFNAANNINGINGDLNGDGLGLETHSLEVPAVTAAQESYVRKLVDTLNDLDNIFWEISNESWAGSVTWQYHIINFIKSYEATKPKQRLVWMTGYMVPNASLFEGPADCVSPCRKDGTNYRGNPPATKGDKIIILDTDHIWGLGGDRKWAWKSFIRGYHPIFMDPMYGMVGKPNLDPQAPQWVGLRRAMGHTRIYAEKMNLARMAPRDELCSTRYCLAHPGVEYLAYQPDSGRFTAELPAGRYQYEWFNPQTGSAAGSGVIQVSAGSNAFTPPFGGDAVLWLRR